MPRLPMHPARLTSCTVPTPNDVIERTFSHPSEIRHLKGYLVFLDEALAHKGQVRSRCLRVACISFPPRLTLVTLRHWLIPFQKAEKPTTLGSSEKAPRRGFLTQSIKLKDRSPRFPQSSMFPSNQAPHGNHEPEILQS